MQLADLLAALPARVSMPAKTLEMSAIHEAGHAIVALENGKTVLFAQVTREIEADSDSFAGGCVSVLRSPDEIYMRSKSHTMQLIRHLLGGLAAEDVFYGERNDGGWCDLREATFLAARMEMSTGQSGRLVFLANSDMDAVLAALKSRLDIQKRVEETLQQCMSEARAIMERRRDDVRKIADALVERGHLKGNEINELLAPNPVQFVQRENALVMG